MAVHSRVEASSTLAASRAVASTDQGRTSVSVGRHSPYAAAGIVSTCHGLPTSEGVPVGEDDGAGSSAVEAASPWQALSGSAATTAALATRVRQLVIM